MGSPIVNTVVFWVMNIIPVYGFAAAVDAILLNTIVTFTGSNPLAMNEGETKTHQWAHLGKTYTAVTEKNIIRVTDETGADVLTLNYSELDKTMYATIEGKQFKVITIFGDVAAPSAYILYAADGTPYAFDTKINTIETVRLVKQEHVIKS